MPRITNFNPTPPQGNNNNTGNPPISTPPGSIPNVSAMGGYHNNQTDDVTEMFIDYNAKFQTGHSCMFRDEILQQLLSILIGKKKPNALLVGSAGVGKTNIVEYLAYMIANKNPLIPKVLANATIYELPLSNIIAGSGIVGELEKKMQAIIAFAENPKNNCILFIDEIHQLLSGGQTYEKIAQMLKPAMARGSIKIIGATTLQESQNFLDDPAFARRFSRLLVDELSREQTIEILKTIKGDMFTHYNNFILTDDAILESIAIYADEYKPVGSHRPDNAITLFDRAMADTLIKHNALLEQVKNDPILYQAMQATRNITLSEAQVKKTAMRLMTGNNKQSRLNPDMLRQHLSVIKGQDDAIDVIVDALRRYDLNIYPKKKPLTFLFAGTSGVGKTEVAKIIANELTGMKPIILNMTEYHSSASINRLIGSPAGYVGSDSNQELPFDCLETNPYQVILLDEFEKCDKSVQRLFMSAFEEGIIKTNRGKEIDFSKCIMIVTTNAAHKSLNTPLGFITTTGNAPKTSQEMAKSLSNDFDTELLNRIEHSVEFNTISKEIYTEIIRSTYERDIARIKSEHKRTSLPDTLSDKETETLVEQSFIPEFGARPAGKTIKTYIEDYMLNEQVTFCPSSSGNMSTDIAPDAPMTESAESDTDMPTDCDKNPDSES